MNDGMHRAYIHDIGKEIYALCGYDESQILTPRFVKCQKEDKKMLDDNLGCMAVLTIGDDTSFFTYWDGLFVRSYRPYRGEKRN